jgi:hypothetical protein
MASDDLICGTPGIVCNIDGYPACPQSDYSSVFDAWGQPALTSTGITTEFEGGELARAQLDSYVLHSLAGDESVCYRETDSYGQREWFVHNGFQGFVNSSARLPFFESAQGDEGPAAKAAVEEKTVEAVDVGFFEGALLAVAGIIVLYTMGKSIIDAADEGQRIEALNSKEVGEQSVERDSVPIVARPSHEVVAKESDRVPWKAEKWFDGLTDDLARFEVNEILNERIPRRLGDPVFRADFVRDGRITVEGVRMILAERGMNYTSVGSVAVTRAMETKAAESKVTPITAGRKGNSSPQKRSFRLFDLFRKIGR